MSDDFTAQAILRLAAESGLLPPPTAMPEAAESPARHLTGLLSAGLLTLDQVSALRNAVAGALATDDGKQSGNNPVEASGEAQPLGFRHERYRLDRLIGQGGMGRVYRAYDVKLQRVVALKFLQFTDDETRQRFFHEARSQARITHPNVCQVYDVGQHEGQLYIAMELVEGEPLGKASGQLTLEEKILLLKQVADALQAAHRLGIIHRDIKSSNIIAVKAESEQWRAVLLDFGLARDLDSAAQLTQTHALLGTPSYMSPEQVRGDSLLIDRRSDLYSMGAVLYELLTGTPPFVGSVEAVIRQTLQDDPVPPRQRQPSIPLDLEIITLKCLAKEPQQRYGSSQQLSDDLERYLLGRPILARKSSLFYRLRKMAARHVALLSLGLLLLVSAATLLGLSVRAQHQAEHRARLAQQLGREIEQSDLFLRMVYSLPLHDVRKEESVVRERVARMQRQLARMPPLEASLAHYAIGRSLLILRDYDDAITHLKAAVAPDPADPEVHQTLGRALGARYNEALTEIGFDSPDSWLALRKQQLGSELLTPARQHLERARTDQSGEALLNRAILHLHREEYDQALEAAAAAAAGLALESWRSEAKKVTGDIEAAISARHRHRGEVAPARSALERALVQYRAALEMSRSDPTYHLALAQTYHSMMILDRLEGKSPQSSFDNCLAACNQLQTVLPDSIAARRIRAQAHLVIMGEKMDSGQDIESYGTSALSDLQYIAQRKPQYPLIAHSQSQTCLLLLWARFGHGLPLGNLPELAEQLARKAAAQQDNPGQAYQILGDLYGLFSYRDFLQGNNPIPWIEKTKEAYLIGLSKVQGRMELYDSLIRNYGSALWITEQYGLPTDKWAQEAVTTAQEGLAQQPDSLFLRQGLGRIRVHQAELALQREQDPEEFLAQGQAELEAALKLQPSYGPAKLDLCRLYQLRARLALRRGQDAEPLYSQARTIQEGTPNSPLDPSTTFISAQLLLLRAELDQQEGKSPEPTLLELARAMGPLLNSAAFRAEASLLTAKGALLLGQWQRGAQRNATLQRGLAAIEQTLSLRPKWPLAQALRQAMTRAGVVGTTAAATHSP